jgi:hypothetical protein
MTGPAEPPRPGTYMPPPTQPDCYRCGWPAAEHEADGQCPAAPLPDCYRCGRPAAEHRDGQCPRLAGLGSDVAWAAKKGFATVALLVAIFSGVAWFGTAGAAQSCTFAGPLGGGTCYPFLNEVHTASGPLALVLLVVAAVLFVVPSQR